MLQAVLQRPQEIVIREAAKPSAGRNEILIKVKRIGICGSDIHAYYGKHPYISCPIIQGHEFSGQIAEIGNSVEKFKVGDDVTVMPQLVCGKCHPCTHGRYNICNSLRVIGCQADGAAQEYIAVDEKLAIRLPKGMDYDYGAMIEPVAVGVHAIGRLGDVKDMNILILGAGPIGNLTAQSAKGLGAKSVMITDLSDYRLSLAKECGIDYTVNTSSEDLETVIKEYFGEDGPDALLECVGVQSTVEQAVKIARKGTDIIIVGVFGQKSVVDMGLVQDKELRLIGTLMYMEQDYHRAIELINSGKIMLKPLITAHFPFRKYGEAYKYIEKNKEKSMKILIDVEELGCM